MPGAKAGGIKAAETNRRIHGKDFYARIGAKGGRNGNTGGFAANPELAKEAGRKGGKASKRGPAKDKLPHLTEADIREARKKHGLIDRTGL